MPASLLPVVQELYNRGYCLEAAGLINGKGSTSRIRLKTISALLIKDFSVPGTRFSDALQTTA
jgi:hypothetical protein